MVLAERGWHDFSIYPKRSCTFRRTNPPLVYALCNDTLCRLRYQYKGLYISYTTYNNISYTTKWNNPLCGLFCLFVWLSQALRVTVNKYFIGFTSFKYYAVLLLSWSVQLAINSRNINSWVSVALKLYCPYASIQKCICLRIGFKRVQKQHIANMDNKLQR